MAITILRKSATGVQPIAQEPSLSDRQVKALEDAGLLPAASADEPNPLDTPVDPSLAGGPNRPHIKKETSYQIGDRVVVVNTIYTWIKYALPGDKGTVLRITPPVPEAKQFGPGYGILDVALDVVRQDGKPTALFSAWEVDPVLPGSE